MQISAPENGVPRDGPTAGDVRTTCPALPTPLSALGAVSTATPARPAATPTLLYDSRRGVHYPKPLLRGWLHLVWFAASLIAGPLLLAGAHGVAHRIGVATYAGKTGPIAPGTMRMKRLSTISIVVIEAVSEAKASGAT